jgi:lysophospholipase L1-like esterase
MMRMKAPSPRVLWANVGLACGAIVLVLFALDRFVAWTDLGYRAARYRPNEDRRLVRDEFDVRVVTNRQGIREARLPGPKPPGVLRIVALGDSFTQGYGVEEAEAYPRLLEQRLTAGGTPTEVVNLGVPGTSPRDYVAHLADPGLAYEPDLVLVSVMANDVQDVWIQRRFGVRFAAEVLRGVQRELVDRRPLWRRAPALVLPNLYPLVWTQVASFRAALSPEPAVASPAPSAPTGPRVPPDRWRDVVLAMGERFGRERETAAALANVPPERAAAIEAVATGAVSLDSEEGVTGYLPLLALVEPRLLADAVLLPATYDDAWEETAGYLHAMVRSARRAGSRVAIVYVPAIHQVSDVSRPDIERDGFEWDPRTLTDTTFPDRLRAFGAHEDVAVIDLLPVFRGTDARALYFVRDGHWTPAGHRRAADALVAAIAHLLGR